MTLLGWFSVIFMLLWLLSVLGIVVLYFVKLRPLIREMQKTPEGRMALVKIMFPPRFHK